MFNRVAFPSLAEGVEAGEIEIPYFLISAHFVIEFISVSAPAKQGVLEGSVSLGRNNRS